MEAFRVSGSDDLLASEAHPFPIYGRRRRHPVILLQNVLFVPKIYRTQTKLHIPFQEYNPEGIPFAITVRLSRYKCPDIASGRPAATDQVPFNVSHRKTNVTQYCVSRYLSISTCSFYSANTLPAICSCIQSQFEPHGLQHAPARTLPSGCRLLVAVRLSMRMILDLQMVHAEMRSKSL